MNFTSIRLITADIKRLVPFYEQVTGMPAIHYTDDFAEVRMPSITLAIGSIRTMQLFGEVAYASGNKSVIIEFRVNDVDAEYEKLSEEIVVIQKPTTMPWGNRSLLFQDPDGNLINFFAPVTAEALSRFDGR